MAQLAPEGPARASTDDLSDSGSETGPSTPQRHRRLSMEEDLFYREFLAPKKSEVAPVSPPSYIEAVRAAARSSEHRHSAHLPLQEAAAPASGTDSSNNKGKGKQRAIAGDSEGNPSGVQRQQQQQRWPEEERLPEYSCDIFAEGVFSRKMEIERVNKRALDRNWRDAFFRLEGTILKVYRIKRDWGWGRNKGGPNVSPDNPPWVKPGALERTYSLQHADVGIAADYCK